MGEQAVTQSDFVAKLPAFTRFADVADPGRFAPAPGDWPIYCCDVVNSTQAIGEGRNKAVNMMGAACIMAAVNAAAAADDGAALAYVFGGDGATILAPSAVRSQGLAPSALYRRRHRWLHPRRPGDEGADRRK